MEITFCGHAQVSNPAEVMGWLRAVTQDLIERGGTTFYLGGYGEFDSLAAAQEARDRLAQRYRDTFLCETV